MVIKSLVCINSELKYCNLPVQGPYSKVRSKFFRICRSSMESTAGWSCVLVDGSWSESWGKGTGK